MPASRNHRAALGFRIVPVPRPLAPRNALRIDPRRDLVIGTACWTGFLVVLWLVIAGRTHGFDQAGLLMWRSGPGLQPRGPSWLIGAMLDVTALGGVGVRNLLAIAATAALLVMRRRREALVFASTVIGAWITDWLIKIAVARPRPQIVPHLADASGMSFPSGHSFNAAAIYIAMALAFGALSPRRGLRITLVSGAVALSLLVALSRVWLGVHYPSDVIAGWLGGTGWALHARAIASRPSGSRPPPGPDTVRIS